MLNMATDEDMRPPDIKIAGFCIWVFGRQFDESQHFWDGNWVRVLAHCSAEGAEVRASGSILHLSELRRWLKQSTELHRNLTGIAELDCIEPNLNAKIDLKDGRGQLVVHITPDHLMQQHRFTFEIDQSYLPELTGALEKVLREFPVRGKL
jgi:hypothetical protein